MSPRLTLLTCLAALGMLAGCNRGASLPPPSSESGTTAEQVQAPPEAPGEDTGSGPAAAPAELPQGPTVFVVRDSGVRCITYPCPSLLASRPDRPGEDPLRVHDMDLSAVTADESEHERLMMAVYEASGLKVEATVEVVPKAGPAGSARVLRVRKVLQ